MIKININDNSIETKSMKLKDETSSQTNYFLKRHRLALTEMREVKSL